MVFRIVPRCEPCIRDPSATREWVYRERKGELGISFAIYPIISTRLCLPENPRRLRESVLEAPSQEGDWLLTSSSLPLSPPELQIGLCPEHGLAPAYRRSIRPRSRNCPKSPKEWPNTDRLRGEAHNVQVCPLPYSHSTLPHPLTRRVSLYKQGTYTDPAFQAVIPKINFVTDFQQLWVM